nr:GGDEF domain-containing phosphodiesterase [Echinimonas agarilytica]
MNSFLKSWISKHLLLSDVKKVHSTVDNWRVSALRIILVSGLILCSLIFIDSSIDAYQLNLTHIILIVSSFYAAMIVLLRCSRRYFYASSYGLLTLILAACICINLFVRDHTLVYLGDIFLYSLPVVGLLLLGVRVAMGLMIVNFIPFYLVISETVYFELIELDIMLERTPIYLHGLVFLFFNFCIPLSAARAISAANNLSKQQKKTNQALRLHHDMYRSLFVDSAVSHLIINQSQLVIDANASARQLLQIPAYKCDGKLRLSELLPALKIEQACGVFHVDSNGQNRIVRFSQKAMVSKGYKVFTFVDVSAEVGLRKELQVSQRNSEKIKRLDAATGLLNRASFERKLEQLIAAHRYGLSVAVIEVCNAQYLKQKYGADVLAIAIKKAVGDIAITPLKPLTCATIDERQIAIVYAEPLADRALRMLEAVMTINKTQFQIDGKWVNVELKSGLAMTSAHGQNAAETLNNAVYATGLASARHATLFDPSHMQRFIERQEIAELLIEAIRNDELHVMYQAKVDSDSKLIGFEALSRWDSPVLGSVPPSEFVSVAESRNIINELTRELVRSVCAQIRTWLDADLHVVPIAVNLSAIDLEKSDFVVFILETLSAYKVKPKYIELELTESALGRSSSQMKETITTLSDWGFMITIDDFGSGYSNLSRLLEFPVDRLKIDRQFVTRIHEDPKQSQIVEMILAMCKTTGIESLAEGTEIQAQVDELKRLGCYQYQGFGFAKPERPEFVVQWLRKPSALLPMNAVRPIRQSPLVPS